MRPFLRVLGLRTLRDGVNGVRADGVTSSDGTSSGRKRSAPVFPLQSRQLEVEAVVDVDVEFLGRDVGHAHAEELERWQVVLCQRVDEVVQDEPTNPRLLADNPCREVLRLGHLSVDRHVLPHSREEMRRVVPAPVGQDGVGGMCVCVCVRCVVWLGVVWCGVVWCGVVRCGVVWCGLVWCGVEWCGVVWCGVWWCGVVWWCVVWRDVVWCGVVSCRVWCVLVCGVECGVRRVVWCGVVW